MNQSTTKRKKNILAIATVFLAMIFFIGSTPVQAQGKGAPDYFVVSCKLKKGAIGKAKVKTPQGIHNAIAKCHASGGKVAGVTPIWVRGHDDPKDPPKDGPIKNPKDHTKG